MPRKSNRQPPRPFRCRCGQPLEQHEFSGAQQMKVANGMLRLHAHIRCTLPAWVREWWSRHSLALARSREVDAMNRAGGEVKP